MTREEFKKIKKEGFVTIYSKGKVYQIPCEKPEKLELTPLGIQTVRNKQKFKLA